MRALTPTEQRDRNEDVRRHVITALVSHDTDVEEFHMDALNPSDGELELAIVSFLINLMHLINREKEVKDIETLIRYAKVEFKKEASRCGEYNRFTDMPCGVSE